MNSKLMNNILDLILKNEVQGIEIIKEQRKHLIIDKAEFYNDNKYITFVIDEEVKKVDTTSFGTMSVMFWDLTYNIPIDCILHFKYGYIYSLEVYSCDGQAFENLDIKNIDIKVILPNNE